MPTYKSIITENWQYTRYDTGEEELYDLSADPYETDNLTDSNTSVRDGFRKRLEDLKDCSGEGCRAAER